MPRALIPRLFLLLIGALGALGSVAAERMPSVAELQRALAGRQLTSEALTRTYLERARRFNARWHAVITLNPDALAAARRSDRRRIKGAALGPLDGLPIWIKDNIDVLGMPTTAGSLALRHNLPSRDADLIVRLKSAGVVILGKSNLSEWANIRSTHALSGWSAMGGLTHNPYAYERTACGSSSGSAVLVSAGLAPFAVGTETDGSITCPSAMTGLVGLKPTVGLVSRSGVIPISSSQDSPGPMARSVEDVALLLEGMRDTDAAIPGASQAARFAGGWNAEALRGARLGVLRNLQGYSPQTLQVFAASLRQLERQGAVLVDIDHVDAPDLGAQELSVLLTEFKAGLEEYLASAPAAVSVRTLPALIAFNRSEPRETAVFDQDLFERAAVAPGLTDPDYLATERAIREQAGAHGIDRLLESYRVIVLLAPTVGPAWTIDVVNGDPGGGGSATSLPAIAGYPHLTVPMGAVAGLPVGLSFIGPAWSEALLLSLGHAFEQASPVHQPPLLKAR
jgi:amidase